MLRHEWRIRLGDKLGDFSTLCCRVMVVLDINNVLYTPINKVAQYTARTNQLRVIAKIWRMKGFVTYIIVSYGTNLKQKELGGTVGR